MRHPFGIVLILLAVGCELPDSEKTEESVSENQAPVAEAPVSQSAPAAGGDQAEWDAIRWQGGSAAGAVRVMTLSAQVTDGGKYVRFTWDQYPWKSDGLGHFFVWDGSTWVGGKFEWIRRGGQAVKTLENVRSGYNGLRPPASGTPVAFAWTSADARQRSNLAKSTWP